MHPSISLFPHTAIHATAADVVFRCRFRLIASPHFSSPLYYLHNKNNEYLTFEEMTEDAESNIDTENAQVYYTEIHGNTALVSVKADLTIVSWNEQNRILSVVFDGEVEEDALKVAKSVTRIK
ncbi:MAG: DUF4367 domain-containing protein [Christensenellales bacterium]